MPMLIDFHFMFSDDSRLQCVLVETAFMDLIFHNCVSIHNMQDCLQSVFVIQQTSKSQRTCTMFVFDKF